uniref:CSON011314 protein n=1 Tax=Culicoides sonorensis TaxID=179676 RepID=A0A336LL58_CULSO
MATINCDIGATYVYSKCYKKGNKLVLYNFLVLFIVSHIIEQITCKEVIISLNDVEKEIVDKKVVEDDFVYVRDYLKRIRETEKFGHYLSPQYSDYSSDSLYEQPSLDYFPYIPYNSYYPESTSNLDHSFAPFYNYNEIQSNSQELKSFEKSADINDEKNVLPLMFGESKKQMNFSITSPNSIKFLNSDYENNMYLLHNKDIVQIMLKQNEVEFETIATITDTQEEIHDIHLISWHELLIIVAREGDHHNVYVKTSQSNNLRNIQRLVFPNSNMRKFKLVRKNEEIYLVVTIGLNKAIGKIILYKWYNSHFIKEHEKETFVVDEMLFFNSQQDPLIMIVSYGSRLNTKTKANLYHIASDGKLDLLQYIFFGMDVVHKFTLQNVHYILACYSKNVCFIHKFDQDKFIKVHQIDRKYTRTIDIQSDNSLICLQLDTDLIFFVNPDLTESITNTDISPLYLYKISFVELEESNRKYIVLFYLYPSYLNIQMLEVEINQNHIVGETQPRNHEHESIKIKMNELRLLLESRSSTIREIDNLASDVIRKDKSMHIEKPLSIAKPVFLTNGLIKSLEVHSNPLKATAEQLLHDIVSINSRTFHLIQNLTPFNSYTNMVYNDRFKRDFKPHYKTVKFIAKHLHYDGPEFKNLLLKSTSNAVPVIINAQTLETNYIYINKNIINHIDINDIVINEYNDTITGHKSFKKIKAKTLLTNQINERNVNPDFSVPTKTSFRALEGQENYMSHHHDLTIDKLQVSQINSLPWIEIEENSVVKEKKHVKGNIYLKRASIARNLKVDSVNDIDISDIMTKQGDQQIHSSIWINNFYAPTISSRSVNGINFRENVALQGQENHIQSHVVISKMNVTSGLQLTEEGVANSHHVVGTKKEDLLQLYTGNVVIQGSLTLNRVQTDSDFTKVLINNREFRMDVDDIYWVDHKNQNIPSFTFHSTVTVPQLYTNIINSHKATDYLLTNHVLENSKHTKIVMKHSKMLGNVIPETDRDSKLAKINRECIRRGDSTDIKGALSFEGELTVDSLSALSVNDQSIENLVKQSSISNMFKGTKRVHNINIYGNLYSSDKFNVQNYNGTDYGYFMSNAVYINEPFHLKNALFDEIRIHNLTVHEMQGITFDIFLSNMYSVLNSSTSIRNIRVNENAFFEHELHVDMINDVDVEKLFKTIVRKDKGAVIHGRKILKNELNIKQNTWMSIVNGYDIHFWKDAALTSHTDQIITSAWTIKKLKTKYFDAKYLNEIDTSDMLYAKDPILNIYSDIFIEHLKVASECKANLKDDINSFIHAIQNPLTKQFDTVLCESSILHPMHFKSKFTDILTDAVTVYGDKTINAKVEFINRSVIKHAKSTTELINGINIFDIHSDALKYISNSKKQIVYGAKQFIDPIDMKFTVVKYKLDAPYINDINIVELNNTIYRKNQGNYIMEKKIFHKTPIIGELYVNGFVNGVKLEHVAFEKDKKLLENVFIHQLQVVNDLLVQNINNMSLDYLLQNRIRLNGPSQEIYGALTFQKLEIFGLNFIPTINGINSNSFVYLMYPETQMISGKKSIKNSLYINGPMHCMRLNNIELSETITSNAKLDLHENLKNLNVKNLIVHSGIVITEHMDNQLINSITQLKPKTLNNLLPNVPYLRNYVQSTSELLQSKPVTKRFLYLDYATDMEIVYKSDDIDSIQGHLQLIVDSNNECPEQLDIKVTNAGKIFIRKRTVEHLTLCADPRMQLNLKLAVKNCVFENNVLISWINANKTSEIQYNMHGQIKSKLYCFNVNDKQFVGFLKAENEHLHTFDIIYLTKGNQWSLKDVLDIQDATNAKIITTNSYTLLVVTSKKGVEFFNLNKLDEKFELLEIITGSYNLISDLVSVGDDKMIVLALKNSKSITIFKLIEDNKDGPEIQFFQNLRFEGRVKSLTAFAMNGESHLAVIMTNGHFYVYRYNFIDGWIQINYSYFDGIESLVTFFHQNKEYLLVVSPSSASAIRIYYQN